MTEPGPEDQKRERFKDALANGCFFESLGCAADGCLGLGFTIALAFIWLLS